MIFRPHIHRMLSPRSGGASSGFSPLADQSQRPVGNVLLPIPITIDLLTIPAPANTKDFFLWQPYQNTLEDAYLGADVNNVTTPEPVRVQLIQKNGNEERELTDAQEFSQFGLEPVKLGSSAQVLDGPVFLRVSTQPTDRLLFATMHVMTPEIP